MIKFVYRFLQEIGIDLRKPLKGFIGLVWYFQDLIRYARQKDVQFPIARLDPCLSDRFASSGLTQSVYFIQDLHVAQLIQGRNPEKHVDIGSRVDGFVAHVATFRPVEVYDIRPNTSTFENIRFVQADLTQDLSSNHIETTDSLSSLHAIEHFGLGRYGDPLLSNGWKIGLYRMLQILRAGGTFYLSVPVGRQRCEFNSQRIFSLKFISDELQGLGLEIQNIWLIVDCAKLESIPVESLALYEGIEACAIFDMKKVSVN